MMSAMVLLASVCGAPDAPMPPQPLSATEAASSLDARQKPVTVRLRIGSVEKRTGGWVLVAGDKLEYGARFEVRLSPAAAADFARLGVSDLAGHFAGREVEVRGRVGWTVVWIHPAYDLYIVDIESLDQFRAVR